MVDCPDCGGSGECIECDADEDDCPACFGTGACEKCDGQGKVIATQ